MDQFVEFQQRVEGGPIGRRDELHGVGRQIGGRKGFGDQDGERGVGVKNFLPPAENGGVAGFQAEDGTVDGDVGAGFVDDADDADGHTALFKLQAVGLSPAIEGSADGVREEGDLTDGFSQLLEARGRKREAVDLRVGQAVGGGVREVDLIGGKKLVGGGGNQLGEFLEGGVFLGGRGGRQNMGRGASALGDRRDELSEFSRHGAQTLRARWAEDTEKVNGSERVGLPMLLRRPVKTKGYCTS